MPLKFLLVVILAGFLYPAVAQLAKGVTCAERKIIVDTHNGFRMKIANGSEISQPKASNMLKMVWDDELATLAQNYANKMTYQCNSARSDSRFAIGENLYISFSTIADEGTFDWTRAITAWYSRVSRYTYRIYQPIDVNNLGTGNYTQVVWADTEYIGCGAAYFKSDNGWYHKLYVCNYGPAGNVIGKYPYIVGPGCEKLCCTTQCGGQLYGTNCV